MTLVATSAALMQSGLKERTRSASSILIFNQYVLLWLNEAAPVFRELSDKDSSNAHEDEAEKIF